MIAAIALLVGLSAVPASAEPAGCTASSRFMLYGQKLRADATGSCAATHSRTMYAELKWDKNLATDPLVAKRDRTSSGISHTAQVTVCDGGNTRAYYARGYFQVNPTYRDTPPKSTRAC